MQTVAHSTEPFVIATIAELARCRPDEVTPPKLLADLGVDSLAIATLVAFVEAEYGCTFTPDQLKTLYSAIGVGDVLIAVDTAVRGLDRVELTTPHAGQAL